MKQKGKENEKEKERKRERKGKAVQPKRLATENILLGLRVLVGLALRLVILIGCASCFARGARVGAVVARRKERMQGKPD